MPFHLFVDDVAQGALDHLSDVGCRLVTRFLGAASQQTNRNAIVDIRLDGALFDPAARVMTMQISRNLADGFFGAADILFDDGSKWTPKGITLPDVKLPETVLTVLAGRTFGEVVDGAVLGDRVIESARSFRGRPIMTVASVRNPMVMPAEPSLPAEDAMERLMAMVAEHPCDPLVAAMLRTMDPADAQALAIGVATMEHGAFETGVDWPTISGGAPVPGIADPLWGDVSITKRKGRREADLRIGGCSNVDRDLTIAVAHRILTGTIDHPDRTPLSHATGFTAPIDPQLRRKVRHGMVEHHIDGTTTFGHALRLDEVGS
jgi:hypothetical protein